ncbi:MAG: SDR family oxidoreductase [Candidatus Latescibacteria bacterium]|nr:SDR family oxidoreductase [bacterium]MBD3425180.1 SDR family oxidoreductase [Candidatus Latescibacterota bacterium]
MKIDLTGTTALVTGSSRGIGRAIAEALGKAGAAVAVHCRERASQAAELSDQLGNDSAVFTADLQDPMQAVSLFRQVLDKYGRVDLLVNNAGIFEHSPLVKETPEWIADWERTIAVNLTGAGILCREAINHFIPAGGGRIINIASRAAFRGETADHLHYAASKGGLVSLSRSIARSFGNHNIKCFTIAPGFVRTEMIDHHLQGKGEEEILNELALSRLTTPGDIAPVAVLIAGGGMDHATGTTIDINGGSYMH